MPTTAAPADFIIGSVAVQGRAILAPMAGFSDLPFRAICRERGSAISYTPCITDVAVTHGGIRTEKLSDFLDAERPVAVQLLGADERALLAAADQVMAQRPDIIDLNMGCPARRVVSGGRGAALLCEPQRIARLMRKLVDAMPVPVTGKIRLGWDATSRNYLEVARILEDNGVAAIAVHGRTRAQQYSGVADWQAIREVKAAASVPVIGNGDVRRTTDVDRMREITGCDAVMIGRGAIGNPWIFAGRALDEVSYPERLAVVRRHVLWMSSYYGEAMGIVLFRKHVVRYVQGLRNATSIRPALLAAETVGELFRVLESWSPDLMPGDSGEEPYNGDVCYED
ncbi:MAG: tRNA dihydrouridine synthase DusB [Anaerolineae bacterium]